MISLDEARRRLLEHLKPTDGIALCLAEASGCILADPMVAQRTQPPFSSSAMDGYAVRSADLAEAPARFRLAGESAAGHAFSGTVEPGMAVRISTGAPVPDGADQVVMQERATREGSDVVLDDTARPAANIRPAGIDFFESDILLPAGARVSPEAVALAAGAGLTALTVHRRPKIGVLATGDELVEPGEPAGPSQIVNSVSKGVIEALRTWRAEPVYLGIARDRADDVRARLAAGAGLDLVVTIGGASVGDHDHLRQVFASDGGDLVFEKIAVKPGKPTWFGRLGDVPYLGLPGNPVSALVIAQLLLRPAVGRLEGRSGAPAYEQARLACALPANGRREAFLRARCDEHGDVEPLDNQDSSALSALVRANCLIRRPADAPALEPGAVTDILRLSAS
jgi:molybdopterin molybdotransferase